MRHSYLLLVLIAAPYFRGRIILIAGVAGWAPETTKQIYMSEPRLLPSNHNKLHKNRREILDHVATLVGIAGIFGSPQICGAGEIGEKITRVVTESELGVSVRREVVRGAQVFDRFDRQWEQLSDKYGLGSERSKQAGRPKPKVIPALKPLDSEAASKVIAISDSAFVSSTNVDPSDLQQQILKVSATVGPSFARSGLSKADMQIDLIENGIQFNYASYVHFKAYVDIIIEKKLDFRSFKNDFERQVGQQLVMLLVPKSKRFIKLDGKTQTPEQRRELLLRIFETTDDFCHELLERGFIALYDRSNVDEDDVDDWSNNILALSWNIALDGDITTQSQILLQEQGYLLYPNFARFALRAILSQMADQISVEDYYMDTDYNSDPDKFDVKEVLININIDST